MSPEQAQGKKVDHRTDIYSLGCILYEALTGAPPLMGGTVIETMVKQINETPMSLHDASLGRDFPPLLEEIVFRALEKDPEKRFQSVKEFADSLRASMQQLPEFVDEPQGKWLSVKKLFKARFERPEGIALALVAGFCLILAVAGYFFVTDTSGNINNANSKTLDDDFARIKTVIAPHDQKEVAAKVFSEPKDSVEDEQSFPEQLATVSPEIVIKSMIRYAKGHDGEISLDRLAFTGKTLDMLAGSSELQTLYIKHCIVGDIFFDHITGIPLKKLSIEYLDISDAGMAKIHDLPGLSFLEMKRIGPQKEHQHIGAAGLVGLARLPHLRTLILKDERLEDSDLSALPGIKRLKALELTCNFALTAKACRYIEQLGDLDELTMRLSKIPLSALEGMKNFPNLRSLSMSESNQFTRQDLGRLSECGKSLESLDLSKTKIDDHQLSALRNMKKLRELNIQNCRNLQQSAVQRLSSELPDCLITSDFK